MLMDSPPPDYAGTLVGGRYRVETPLGKGAMGSVWAGRHVTLGQLVAIKFIHPRFVRSEHVLRRFETEAKAATLIKSRYAVRVHDHGVTDDGQPYIVMDHLEGESLEQALERRGRLPLAEVVEIVEQAASALQAAHDAGVIHRDLKPDNIFLATDQEAGSLGYSVKIVDFGIAKIAHEQVREVATTQAGTLLGTPFYMSPEALAGFAPVTALSDIWALGACAFAAACGVSPFSGDTLGDVVLRVCSMPLPVPSVANPRLPRAFDAWFARACARQPARRFADCRELALALRATTELEPPDHAHEAYQLQPRDVDALDSPFDTLRPSARGRLLGGVLVGVSITIAALGYYVRKRTLAAEELARKAAEEAQMIIEEENERRLREASEQARGAGSLHPKSAPSSVPSRETHGAHTNAAR